MPPARPKATSIKELTKKLEVLERGAAERQVLHAELITCKKALEEALATIAVLQAEYTARLALSTTPSTQPATTKPAHQSVPEPAPQAMPTPAPKPAPQPTLQTAPKPAPQTAPQTAPKPAPQTAPKSTPQTTPKPIPQTAPILIPNTPTEGSYAWTAKRGH
ncbi:hypothetical protein BJ085DRAFT_34134 [Dimargaris cristalligena]|uniref:Uncharacterized protein n=1 Tax=Dimargaris cristalligena TaxID=215637 RepID=A0A4V1J3T7_9FUNG|nr:hypothetical protein BJ085DRAFT_34134 [Dimargaris cristalligena]|eukprot:RKP33199.1 hypothetical protein BJ085DRAFT_34134 [Dimargaris cristalligena]